MDRDTHLISEMYFGMTGPGGRRSEENETEDVVQSVYDMLEAQVENMIEGGKEYGADQYTSFKNWWDGMRHENLEHPEDAVARLIQAVGREKAEDIYFQISQKLSDIYE